MNKILENIDWNCFEGIGIDLINQYRFIPVKTHDGNLYIGIIGNENKSYLKSIMTILQNKTGAVVRCLPITEADYKEIVEYYYEHINPVSKQDPMLLAEDKVRKEAERKFKLEDERKQRQLQNAQQDNSQEQQTTEEEENNNTVSQEEENQSYQSFLNEENNISSENKEQEENTQNYSSDSENTAALNSDDVKKDGEHPRKRLGEQLIDAGFLTPEQLEEGLAYAKEKKLPIGSALVELKYITLDQMKTVLSEQQGLEFFELDKYKIERSVFSLLPERYIKSKKVIPIKKEKNFIVIGMVNANDKAVLSQIKFMTGLTPRPLLIPHIEFNNILRAFEMKKQTTQMVQHIIKEDIVEEEESLWEQVDKELKDNSSNVAKFATKIITDAIDIKASDIHIEPRLNGYIVRYRIAGILKLMFEIPQQIESAIISRFKVVSRMDIAEHRRAQDGTFSLKHAGVGYDFRINTLPVGSKEKMVIRILAPSVTLADSQDKDIKLVGGTAEDISKIKKMITVPNGIILTAGPTGSGKTTTLYSVLKNINDVSINISTVEDPIEIRLEGVNQTQVNPKADITFASCMRALLRQDPDVILVGEIRDLETLETAISASLTGHLVLSTVHTNSAAATITRLMDMGAKDYLIASTLSGVIAQRLVRRLCDNCKKEYTPDLDRLKELLPQGEDAEAILKTHKFYRAIGCPQCDGGYSGRLGIYEIMQINKEIRRLIAQNAPDVEIEEVAVACGMKTLRQSCFNHIFNGMTTLEECLRVLGIAND